MASPRPAVHRTVLVVDVERFGDHSRSDRDRLAVRAGLYRALRQAFRDAGISWADCEHENTGDGVLVLAGADVPKAPFVELLPDALVKALNVHNSSAEPRTRIRLRMALHAGEINYDAYGAMSTAINHTFRLVDAAPLRAALAASPGVLALITSSWFFDEVVRHSRVGRSATYRRVWVTVKETTTIAWLCLPGTAFPRAGPRVRRTVTGERTVEGVADQLAVAVWRQWEAEAALRRLNDPHPLPVSWTHADTDLVEDLSLLTATALHWAGGPPSDPRGWATDPAELDGSDSDLSDVLARVPTGRLVVLGEPGTGKTMLLVRLLLDLVARRESGDPVLVLVPIASWDPGTQDLYSWLAARLVTDNPGLRQTTPAALRVVSRVHALLERQLLVPILDGLDEMPDRLRGIAVSGINDALRPGDQVVVSSRVEEYRRVVRPAAGPPVMLRNAAGITLAALDTGATTSYLRRDAGSPQAAARWEPVFAELGMAAPVAHALRTPLMVGLARTVYNPRPGEHSGSLPDPAELCDTNRFRTPVDVERHLFDAFVKAAYRPHPDPDKRCPWPTEKAQHWLGFIAGHLEHRLRTTDFAWWQLRDALPRPLVSLVVGLASGVACGLAAGFGTGIGIGIGIGLGVGIVLGFAVGLPVRRVSRLARGPAGGLAGGLVGGLTGGLVAGLMAGFGAGLPSGIVNGIGVGLSSGLTATLVGRRGPAQGLRWSSLGLAGGVAVGIALGLAAWLVSGPAAGLAVGVIAALATGMAGGLTGATVNLTTVNGPGVVLRRDRRAFAVYGSFAGIATGFVSGLVTGIAATIEEGAVVDPAGLITNGLSIGLVVGFVTGLTLGFVQAAWGAFTIARCWLALRGELPWRLMSFLADAHEQRGVLRQAGAVYQLRHAELQRRLARRDR